MIGSQPFPNGDDNVQSESVKKCPVCERKFTPNSFALHFNQCERNLNRQKYSYCSALKRTIQVGDSIVPVSTRPNISDMKTNKGKRSAQSKAVKGSGHNMLEGDNGLIRCKHCCRSFDKFAIERHNGPCEKKFAELEKQIAFKNRMKKTRVPDANMNHITNILQRTKIAALPTKFVKPQTNILTREPNKIPMSKRVFKFSTENKKKCPICKATFDFESFRLHFNQCERNISKQLNSYSVQKTRTIRVGDTDVPVQHDKSQQEKPRKKITQTIVEEKQLIRCPHCCRRVDPKVVLQHIAKCEKRSQKIESNTFIQKTTRTVDQSVDDSLNKQRSYKSETRQIQIKKKVDSFEPEIYTQSQNQHNNKTTAMYCEQCEQYINLTSVSFCPFCGNPVKLRQ